MKRLLHVLVLSLAPAFACASLSCPDGTEMACLEPGDKVCADDTKCVHQSASCFDDFACDPEDGYVCAGEYDAAIQEHRVTVAKYDALVQDNVDLRQQRLDRKNCVLNSTTLADAHKCVR